MNTKAANTNDIGSSLTQKAPTEPLIKIYKKYILVVILCIWILLTNIGGIYLFTRGFLLSRKVLDNQSECEVTPLAGRSPAYVNAGSDACWHKPTFKKAVVIVIDALRFDFAVYNETNSEPAYYQNKLPIIEKYLKEQPENSFLFQYIADPPTSTLQRLQALTTGSLPTFIDVGNNFAGSAVLEDNLMDQLKKQGKRITFMGDDTWVTIFPEVFRPNHTFPFPSFNVFDLHTVDNGILSRLEDTINGDEWDVLIAHFLGVDHCGHRFGPNHPSMSQKLTEMNQMIETTLNQIDDETVVLIMGDHGMDAKGDHGGDSPLEVQSTLFVHSRKERNSARQRQLLNEVHGALKSLDDHDRDWESYTKESDGAHRTIPQIDFVPTLSFLLGIPVPFNNLGAVIPELFIHTDDGSVGSGLKNLLQITRVNAHQVYQYVHEYARFSAAFSAEVLSTLDSLFDQAEVAFANLGDDEIDSSNFQNVFVLYNQFLRYTLKACRHIWAQFDLTLISIGIGVLLAGVLCIFMQLRRNTKRTIFDVQSSTLINIGFGAFAGLFLGAAGFLKSVPFLATDLDISNADYSLMGTCFGSICGYLFDLITAGFPVHLNIPTSGTFIGIVFAVMQCLFYTSNSFIVQEDKIILGLLQTFGAIVLIRALSISNIEARLRLIFFAVTFLIINRITGYSTICREEQAPYCVPTFYSETTSTVSSPLVIAVHFAFSVLIPFVFKDVYSRTKNFNDVAVIWLNYGLRCGLLISSTYWALDTTETTSNTNYGMLKQLTIRFGFGIALIVGMSCWYTNPVCVDVKVFNTPGESSAQNKPDVIQKPNRTVVVYGYSNAYGSAYFLFVTIVYLFLVLVQKPMGGIMLGLAMVQIICTLEMFDVVRDHGLLSKKSRTPQQEMSHPLPYPGFLEACVFGLLGLFYYYATGHQATLASIQWSTALIGLSEANYLISPILVFCNTFASPILFSIAVPLVVFWKVPPNRSNNLPFFGTLGRLVFQNYLYMSLTTLVMVISVAGFRRHLMVWKVFAPRFMLAGVTLITCEALLVVVGLIFIGYKTLNEVRSFFGLRNYQ
ncbi:mannose-ethanolamine phosphotransferase gpi13 [Basidiobolus ranarum]|uniref:Mannose-ethanolamine phosphotransferase gpi13 n=1 Tax=Basidiobolus ranarum TaxID=34480 RepID=A0ABR2W4S8_9FUNG